MDATSGANRSVPSLGVVLLRVRLPGRDTACAMYAQCAVYNRFTKYTATLFVESMNQADLWLALLGSAGVGALVSAGINAIGQWRERVARERGLLFNSAMEFSKLLAERLAKDDLPTVSEIMVMERMHAILTEIFRSGKMSERNRKFLKEMLDRADDTARGKNAG